MNGINHIRGIIFLLIFLFSNLHAQSFNFKNITTEDGLASSECYKIIQDKKGYIWIATDAGLCKYNGKEFRTFTTDDGLPFNTMFEIMEDQYGRIWGACFNGGIFHIKNDSVHTIPANEELIKITNEIKEMPRKLILDKKNILHLGTTKNYYQISPQDGYKALKKNSYPDTNFTLIKQIEEDVLFARVNVFQGSPRTEKLLHVFENGDTTFKIFSIYTRQKAFAPHYYATRTPGGGFLFVVANSLYTWEQGKLAYADFEHDVINAYYDRNHHLWVGIHDKGYLMFPMGDLSAEPIQGLNGHSVGGFCQDREGGIWINTLDAGIFYHPNSQVYSYNELSGLNIPAVYSGSRGIYASTTFHDVWKVGKEPKCIVDAENQVQNERMQLIELKGQMYKVGGGSYQFDENGRTQVIKLADLNIPTGIANLTLADDIIWGINHEDILLIKDQLVVLKIKLPSRGFCIFYSSRNELLVGCVDGLYEFKNNQFKKNQIHYKGNDVRISSITEDRSGNLLLSTRGHGVFVRKGNTWYNVNTSHGLPSNLCNHIHCSQDGKYFVSTNKGLCVYAPQSRTTIRCYDISNGLLTNEVNMCTTDSGFVYIATEKGLCYFDDRMEVYNISLPPLTTKTIQLNGEEVQADHVYPHYMNDLSFSCDVLSYQRPKSNMIRYQLFPIDKESKYSSSTDINYDNLPPGRYHLFLWAVNNNGIEGIPQTYHFTIRKPFWNTWWFITISALALIGVSYMFVRERINYIRKREEEKTLLKEKIVEYHYTALRAQMNPHFIFNVINSIQLYVLNNQPKEAYNYLSKFSKLIRKVLQNSKEKLISLSDEMETIRLYMELEQIRLEGNVEFHVKIDPSIDQESTLVPSMIIQPLLENAIWHGIVPLKGSRMGKVSLHISSYNQMFRIQIRDNGNGIDLNKPTEEKGSFGLNLIKDRLTLLSDKTQIEIANLLDDKDEIKGVEVTILMPFIKK